MTPSSVSDFDNVGASTAAAEANAELGFASPKSSSLGQHHVSRFEVAMNNAMTVSGFERGGDICANFQYF